MMSLLLRFVSERFIFTCGMVWRKSMGFRVWLWNSIKNHPLTFVRHQCIKSGLNTSSRISPLQQVSLVVLKVTPLSYSDLGPPVRQPSD